MKHLGILATTPDGAALCFRAFCQDGFAEIGPHDHPDVTLDCIALARNLPAWQAGDYATARATLSVRYGGTHRNYWLAAWTRIAGSRATIGQGCGAPRGPRPRPPWSSRR
jgi:hypothetical protein